MAKKKAKTPELSDDDILGGDDDGGMTHYPEDDGKGGKVFDVDADPQEGLHDDINNDDEPLVKKKPKQKEDLEEEEPEDEDEDEEELEDEADSDEDDSGEEEEDEDEDDDYASHSKKVRKRIDRERALKRAAEDAKIAAEDAANERIYKSDLSAYEARKVTLELMKEANERDIKDAKEDLKRATEDEETDKIIEAQVKLQEAIAKKTEIKAGAEDNTEPVKPVRTGDSSPQTKRWIERNRWFTDKGNFESEIAFARQIDADLAKDPAFTNKLGTPEYFAELDKRIHSKMTGLRMTIKKIYGSKKKTNVAPVDRTSRTKVNMKKRRDGKIRLTREQIISAKEFGVKDSEMGEYAKQVAKREREERAERRGER